MSPQIHNKVYPEHDLKFPSLALHLANTLLLRFLKHLNPVDW